MTKNQAIVLRSWTRSDDDTLLLVSTKPISAKKMEQALSELYDKFDQLYDSPQYQQGEPALTTNPKYHREVKRLIRKCLPDGFQLLQVQEFTIA